MDTLCKNTHLNSPLQDSFLRECIENLNNKKKPKRNRRISNLTDELQALLAVSQKSSHSCSKVIQAMIPDLFQTFMKINATPDSKRLFRLHYRAILDFAIPEIIVNDMWPCSNRHEFNQILKSKYYNLLLNLYSGRSFLEDGVNLSARSQSSFKLHPGALNWVTSTCNNTLVHFGEYLGICKIYLTSNFCLFGMGNDNYLVSRDHYLMITDLISQRFLCLFACIIAEFLNKKNYPEPNLILKVFSWGDIILKTFGNQSYETLSLYEPILISLLLKLNSDPVVDETNFYNEIKLSFIKSQGQPNYEVMEDLWIGGVENLLGIITNPDVLSQLFGLYRLWGHPTVDTKEGIRKLKKIACAPKTVNHTIVKLVHRKWREYFCLAYYAKFNHYPKLVIEDTFSPTYLTECLIKNHPVSTQHPKYTLDQWDYLKFNRTFDVPDKFELSEMISDSATSFTYSELRQMILSRGDIGPSDQRSVIIQWLNKNYNDPKEFLEEIALLGFGDDEIVVGVHPKERELKIHPRLFGLLTIKKRLYVVLTEALLADNLFEFFPEITMTFDSVTLLTKIHHNTKFQAFNQSFAEFRPNTNPSYTVVVNIDFQKWNSYMRYDETLPIFSDFDDLFGFPGPVFARSHEMFNPAYLYLADGTITPTITQGGLICDDYVWTGHLGGIEGLRQKGWTIFTVVILKYIAETCNVKCQIMGQGDNQVLILQYNSNNIQEIKNHHNNFMLNLREFLTQIGPPLKVEETWSSSNFFIYGKFPVLKGIPLSMSLKKIDRCMRLTNEGFQNLESTLSSISANCSASTASDHDPIVSFIISTFESSGAFYLHTQSPFYHQPLLNLSNHMRLRLPKEGKSISYFFELNPILSQSFKKKNSLYIHILLMYPCILGGYPTCHFWDLLFRGFPDPLSLNLWGLKKLYLYYDLHFDHPEKSFILECINKIYDPILNDHINSEMICQDPLSLNLLHSSSGSEKIKRMVFTFLTSGLSVKNKVFIDFLQKAQLRQNDLSNLLFQMRPFNPKIANAILESTIVGRAMKMVAKINKTGVLINLMIKSNYRDELEELQNLDEDDLVSYRPRRPLSQRLGSFELNYLLSLLYNLSSTSPRQSLLDRCSVVHAITLRKISWGVEITGVTLAPPMELLSWNFSNGTSCMQQSHRNLDYGYILVRSDIALSDFGKFNLEPSIGPFRPYFGSKTKMKVKYEGKQLKEIAPPMMQGIIDSLVLMGWATNVDSNLSHLIKLIWESFTDLPLEPYRPLPSEISSSVEHRFSIGRVKRAGSLSILYSYASHIAVTTNMFHPETAYMDLNHDDFNIHFQAIFAWISAIFSYIIANGQLNKYSLSYHLHIDCTQCLQPVNVELVDIPELSDDVRFRLKEQVMKDNAYCWLPKENIMTDLNSELDGWNTITEILPSEDLFSLFHELYVSIFFEQNPIPTFDFYKVNYSTDVISLGYSLKIHIPLMLDYFYVHWFCQYLFVNLNDPRTSDDIDINRIYTNFFTHIESTPIQWFYPLLTLLLNNEGIKICSRLFPDVVPPLGTPPTENAKCAYFKLLLEAYSMQITPKKLRIIINKISNRIGVVHKLISFNKVYQKLISILLISTGSKFQNILNHLKVMKHIFCLVITGGKYRSNLKWISIINCAKKNFPFLISKQWIDLEFYLKTLDQRVKYFMGTIDYTSKSLSKRIRPDNTLLQTQFEIPYIDLKLVFGLPRSSTSFNFQYTRICKSGKIELPYKIIELPAVSLIQHFFKTKGVITTSSYKLLSLLNLPLFYSIQQNVSVIACLGDGVGGFLSTLSRIFPNSHYIYNSLFELKNVSSTGTDRYIPPGLFFTSINPSNIDGLQLMEEQHGNLLDSQIVEVISTYHRAIDLIICDAEGAGWENPNKGLELIKSLLILAKKNKVQYLVMKSYSINLSMLYTQLILGGSCFNKVSLVRSHFSSLCNTEVYLIFYDLKLDLDMTRFPDLNVSNDGIMITNLNYSLSFSYDDFLTIVDKQEIYCHNVQLLHIPYSALLNIPIMSQARIHHLQHKVQNICQQRRTFVFPTDLVRKWRQDYRFVKFLQGDKSKFQINLLTRSAMTVLLMDYLFLLSLKIKNLIDVIEFEELLENGIIHFYGTIDGSWSIWCCLEDRSKILGANTKTVFFRDLISSSKRKELFVQAGRAQEFKNQFKIVYLFKSIRNPELFMITKNSEWWNHVNKDTYPLSMLPSKIHNKHVKSGVAGSYTLFLKPPPPGVLKSFFEKEIIEDQSEEIESYKSVLKTLFGRSILFRDSILINKESIIFYKTLNLINNRPFKRWVS